MSILIVNDFSDRRDQFEAWLASPERLDVGTRVLALCTGDGGAGYSNRTVMADVTRPHGERARYVIRFAPAKGEPSLFPSYDIRKQFDLPRALARETDIPVTPGLWFENDSTIFGSPFFVMPFAAGRVPADEPPYAINGFVADASHAQQAALWWSAVDALVKLAKVDPDRLDVPALRTSPGRSALAYQLDEIDSIYRWARAGAGPFPAFERAGAWLRENMPLDEPRGLIWGDARLSNIIYDDAFQAASLLDWELAWVGNPEFDLAYFLLFDRMSQDHIFPSLSAPRPAGFPGVAETIAYYEQQTGIRADNLAYYTVLSIYKNLSHFQRFCDMLVISGRMPRAEAEHMKVTCGSCVGWMEEIVGGAPAKQARGVQAIGDEA